MAAVSASYFLFLLFHKYLANKNVVLLILLLFGIAILHDYQKQQIKFLPTETLLLYPDQIKIKDDYLTGRAHFKQKQIAIAGKVRPEESALLKSGRPVYLQQVNGEATAIASARNPGQFDLRQYYASHQINQQLKFKGGVFSPAPSTFWSQLHYWRFCLQNYCHKLPFYLAFFSSELLLAENPHQNQPEILNNYRNLGVIHLLSISGLHVAIYSLSLSLCCYYLKLTDKEAFLLVSAFLLLLIFLSSGQPGFVRASLTYILGQVLRFGHGRINSYDLLGLTCLIQLFICPHLFIQTGAILSYVLVFALQLTKSYSYFLQSLALNLVILPFLLFYFYQVNFLTPIFNMLVVPYFNTIVLPLTFFNLLLGHFLGLSPLIETILKLCEQLLAFLAENKWGLITFGKINGWQCFLLFLATVFLLISTKKIPKRRWAVGTFTAYLILFCQLHFPLHGQVSFIDVGQGDSILITTPLKRKCFLIDTGGKLNFSGHKITPQVNKLTLPCLKAQGISQLDAVFISHQDADHCGDIGPLLEQMPVKRLYVAKGILKNPAFYKRIKDHLQQTEVVELLAGDQINTNNLNFQVVAPAKAGMGKNEDSLSLLLKVGTVRWLFTGDLDQQREKEILTRYPEIKADYFKLGHHGSRTASAPEFLQQLQPKKVFISAGVNNRFGHPHPETLATLRQQGIPYVSTQDCGMISWKFSPLGSAYFTYFLNGNRS